MKQIYWAAAPLCFAALSGCSSVPDAPVPAPVVASQFSVPGSSAAKDAAVPALDTWWTLFEQPLLNSLVDQALASSTEARMALARIREARAVREAALTQYQPQGGLRASGDRRGVNQLSGAQLGAGGVGLGRQSSAGLDLQVSWELDVLGRGDALARQSDGNYGAALYGAYAERASLVAEVARSLFEAQRLTAALADAQATITIQTRLQQVLARKLERGLVALADVARVDASLLAAQANALVLQSQLDAARRALLVLVGRGDQPLSALVLDDSQTQAPALPRALPADLLARRPDVLQAQAQMDAAAGGLDVSRLALLPSITLTPSLGLNWQNQGAALSTSLWSLAGNVAMPVLDRPRLLANARAQGARAEQAVIAYEQVVQRAFSETDQALLRMAPDAQRLQVLEQAQARAQTAYEAARKGYEAGFFDLVVVLDAEQVYRDSRGGLTQARAEALAHAVQVFQALGGGWPRDALALGAETQKTN
ncbi:NodT family efflux transporter outer membrane factor (OMF) lipoprotein [Comamonas sp. BIGb0152]|uniref:efflux transporter outer membrane subunit n=1 Tax=Comamonas sp. BIGb0152 TaxID=2940601 RepID=UPI002169108A|nr:TolC family protein [Comamonas sp. BIGb0152]MCS4295955.1 NodT family efflux transporter outer membrane factor (OMF) lipoprotein [Comamonas sp. BIGb0152]